MSEQILGVSGTMQGVVIESVRLQTDVVCPDCAGHLGEVEGLAMARIGARGQRLGWLCAPCGQRADALLAAAVRLYDAAVFDIASARENWLNA